MKSRPRSVERKVASHLTEFYATMGLPKVERIPILGRTGPDIEINDFGLVIDVKSRLEVPKGYTTDIEGLTIFGFPEAPDALAGVRLENLPELVNGNIETRVKDCTSKIVRDYYDHMDEWTKENCPSGITALVLHRPKMPIGKAVLIISLENRRRFDKWKIHK